MSSGLVFENKYGSATTKIKLPAAEYIQKGKPLIINRNGQLANMTGVKDSSKPQFLTSLQTSFNLSREPETIRFVQHIGQYVFAAYEDSSNKGVFVLGKYNSDGVISWGVPFVLYYGAAGAAIDFTYAPSTENIYCLYRQGNSPHSEHVTGLSLNFKELSMTGIGTVNTDNSGGFSSAIVYHPTENTLVLANGSSNSSVNIKILSTSNSGPSVLSSTQVLGPPSSGSGIYGIKLVYNSKQNKFLVVFDDRPNSRVSYVIISVSGSTVVLNRSSAYFGVATANFDISYDEGKDRIVMLNVTSLSLNVFTMDGTSVTHKAQSSISSLSHLKTKLIYDKEEAIHLLYRVLNDNSVVLVRLSIDTSSNLITVAGQSEPETAIGNRNSFYLAYSEVQKGLSLFYTFSDVTGGCGASAALSYRATDLGLPLIGFAPDIANEASNLNVVPMYGRAHLYEISETVTPTITYTLNYDGSLLPFSNQTFSAMSIGFTGYAVSANELVVNK